MALPKTTAPTFKTTLPTSDIEIKYRPFLVKEEKLLLMMQDSEDPQDVYDSVRQLIVNCVHTPIDPDKLSMLDMTWIFLQLYSKSVSNVAKLAYQDREDGEVYKFEVNIDDVQVTRDPNHNKVIKLTDTISIVMRYPTFEMIKGIDPNDPLAESKILEKCLDMIIEGEDTVHECDKATPEELEEFIDNLDKDSMIKLGDFFRTQPAIKHELKYKNKKDNDRKIVLEQLTDFFPHS
jgi:hypothetical protein